MRTLVLLLSLFSLLHTAYAQETAIQFSGTISAPNTIEQCTKELLTFSETAAWKTQQVNHYFEDNIEHMSYKGLEITIEDKKPTLDILFTPKGTVKGQVQTGEYTGKVHEKILDLLLLMKEKCIPTLTITDGTGYLETKNPQSIATAIQAEEEKRAKGMRNQQMEENMHTIATQKEGTLISAFFMSLMVVFLVRNFMRRKQKDQE